MNQMERSGYNQADDRNRRGNKLINHLTQGAVEDYMYQFKQGGRDIQGLTAKAANECMNLMGDVENIETDVQEGETFITVKVRVRDNKRNITAPGVCTELKMRGGKPDDKAAARGLSKANRQAILRLIPEVVKQYIMAKLTGQPLPELPSQPEQKKIEGGTSDYKAPNRGAFAVVGELLAPLEDNGIDEDLFWDYIKDKYDVDSRKLLTDMQWDETRSLAKAASDHEQVFVELVHNIKRFERTIQPEPEPDVIDVPAEAVELELSQALPEVQAEVVEPPKADPTPHSQEEPAPEPGKPPSSGGIKSEVFQSYLENESRMVQFFSQGKEDIEAAAVMSSFWGCMKTFTGCENSDDMTPGKWRRVKALIEMANYESSDVLKKCRDNL